MFGVENTPSYTQVSLLFGTDYPHPKTQKIMFYRALC